MKIQAAPSMINSFQLANFEAEAIEFAASMLDELWQEFADKLQADELLAAVSSYESFVNCVKSKAPRYYAALKISRQNACLSLTPAHQLQQDYDELRHHALMYFRSHRQEMARELARLPRANRLPDLYS